MKKRHVVGYPLTAVIALCVGVAAGSPDEPAETSQTTVAVEPSPASAAKAPAEKPKSKALAVKAGVYEVGVDLQPGRWKTSGPGDDQFSPLCYYARLRNDSGSLDAIIANNSSEGALSVTVRSSDAFVEFTGDCLWTKVS
jgi:hypothetical protein